MDKMIYCEATDTFTCPKCGSKIEDKFYDDEDVVSDVATIEVIPIDDEVF